MGPRAGGKLAGVELVERTINAPHVPPAPCPANTEEPLRLARRALRAQIDRLERELANAFVTAYTMGGLEHPPASQREPRMLDLGELERIRDELVERLRIARITIAEGTARQRANRRYLEEMLREPAKHHFARVSFRDLGFGGCGVWQVRPRLGLLGMLMGWWEVKLSSGCPLAGGRVRGPGQRSTEAMLAAGCASC